MVIAGAGNVEVVDVPDAAPPGPDGMVVQVERTAVCGSDLHLYHGVFGDTPVRAGHEFVGTVTDVGPEVRLHAPGDRVLVSAVVACGRCAPCRAGDPVRCTAGATAALGTVPEHPGGQAEAAPVPAADAFARRVPEGVDTEAAVLLTDILPTAYLGARRADITPGDTVAVIGLGPVGVLALHCARLFGPSRLLAVDLVPDRLARAAALGAEPLDAGGGVAEAVLEATSGRGADAVIEAVGADATVAGALACVAPGATVSVVGVNLNGALPIPMGLAFLRSLTLRATFASVPMTWPALVPLLQSGALDPRGVFTHHLGLSEAPEAYRLFDRRTDGVLKVLLDPAR